MSLDTSLLHIDAMILAGFRGEKTKSPATLFKGVSKQTVDHERASAEDQYQTVKALRRRDLWIPVGTTDVLAKNWRHIVRLEVEADEVAQTATPKIRAFQDGREFYMTFPDGKTDVYQASRPVKDFDLDAARAARREFVAMVAGHMNAEVEWEA